METPVNTEQRPAEMSAIESLKRPTREHELLQSMTGVFSVENRIWPEPGSDPMVATAVARRRMIGDLYLEEIMEPSQGSTPPDFSRVCYLDFSTLNRRWEYVSFDTRLPAALMFETSVDDTVDDGNTIVLHLPSFVLPGWGTKVTGQSVRQRREITVQTSDRQIVRQYWTLPAAAPYLAVDYVYSRTSS
jgi:hypothetical protein